MKVYFSPDYVGSAHAFETTRKAGWIADSLQLDPTPGVELVAPEPVTVEQLLEVHSPEYIEAVRTGEPQLLAQSQGFSWDPGLWTMVCATNGGAVAAALTAMKEGVSGSLSSGLHHARWDRGAGFCTFNGLVLAAKAALKAGARKVLILDLDAHCGGGTASLIEHDARIAQLDLSCSRFDEYEPSGNCYLYVEKPQPYTKREIALLCGGLANLKQDGFVPDLILYNAGMDPYPTYSGAARFRERVVFDICRRSKIPVAFVLAGGYLGPSLDQEGLVKLHRETIDAAANRAAHWSR